MNNKVAPHVGAWIETSGETKHIMQVVAPAAPLIIKKTIYVETYRDAVKSVFTRLREQNKDVFRQCDCSRYCNALAEAFSIAFTFSASTAADRRPNEISQTV